MEVPPLAHTAHLLISRISVHQDFFWFFSLLTWSFVLIVWWRHPARGTAWRWLPWTASAIIATALIQFGMFNPTFDIFIDRLVPGTVSDYKPALIDPYWLGDVLIAAALAGMITGWTWQALTGTCWHRLRWLPLPVMTTVLWVHLTQPERGGLLLTGLALLGAAGLWRQTGRLLTARISLLLSALLPLFSSVGPVAILLHSLERAGPPTPFGLGVACFHLLFGTAVLAGLLRDLWPRLTSSTHTGFRRDAGWFGACGLLLLAAGLTLAIKNGRDNRNEIQQNRLRTTAAHALVFDPALLQPLVHPNFVLTWKSPAGESAVVHSSWLAGGAMEAARRRLDEVVVATPFLAEARILILRNGWLAAVLSSKGPAGPVELLRRATPEDYVRWNRKQPYVEVSPVPEIGFDYYCRAPLLGEDGRMLGWLDCVRREYFLSIERRWRVAPFTFTALGLVLLGLVVVQRQGTRERESALRAAAIAAESSRIKTAFLAKVSHELRTPLQSILGYGELLGGEVRPGPGPGRLQALRQQGELMLRLVNDLLDLSAADAGAFQLMFRPVEPAELVRQVIESLRPGATAKGLELHGDFAPGVPAWIATDGDRVRQVLTNLIGNAIKYTDRGRIDVTLRAAAHAPEGRVGLELAVRDTGPGISPADQGRIFDAFSRLEPTAIKEGAGLGLALARALCRALGGDLAVESDGRHGSCFRATLVGEPAAPPAESVAPATLPTGGSPRVLVVDDNPLIRELFLAGLGERGARCRSAASGREALAALAESSAEAIVLDLALPDGDGADFAPRLRRLAPGVRIVGVSAHAGSADRARALAAGMDLFLTKPVPLDLLWQAVIGGLNRELPEIPFFDTPGALRSRLRAEFLAELPARQTAVAAALDRADWPRVRAEAHYLRNGALVIQAREVFAATTGLETAALAADAALARQWWHNCQAAFTALAEADRP